MKFTIIALTLVLSLSACDRKGDTSPIADATTPPSAATTSSANEGEACAGNAGITCATGLYCAMEAGLCGAVDAPGTCQKKPEVCTEENNPVCGCDNKTYSSSCKAASAGVNVNSLGECPQAST
jgi:hypothetical protein